MKSDSRRVEFQDIDWNHVEFLFPDNLFQILFLKLGLEKKRRDCLSSLEAIYIIHFKNGLVACFTWG